MEKKLDENNADDFENLSLYIDKVLELLNNNIIDYQSE